MKNKPQSLSSRGTLRVTLLSSEWRSTKEGLSTVNRELAIQLAKHPDVKVSVYLPECSEEDKRVAASHNVHLIEAQEMPGFDPVDWLVSIPKGHVMDCVIGHGVQLGKQVQLIKHHHNCKWIQVVHTDPEELGIFKTNAEGKEEHKLEVKLCELADQVVAVGPKLAEAFLGYLRPSGKDQNVLNLTPGIFSEFADVKQASKERRTFSVLLLGNGGSQDLQLKGYDIAAKAIAKLKDMPQPYKLKVVGVRPGKEQQVAEVFLQQGISRDQLVVRGFKEREKLAEQFCEVDLAIMPSRSEGFGLPALEALSAGLPVLVSGNSGLGEALKNVPHGSNCVVDSDDPKEWAKAIRSVRQKRRNVRLVEVKSICEEYAKVYSWEEQCRSLVQRMMNITSGFSDGSQSSVAGYSQLPFPAASQTHLTSGTEGFSGGCQSSVAGYSQLPFPAGYQIHLTSGAEVMRAKQIFRGLEQMRYDAGNIIGETQLLGELKKIASDKGLIISVNKGSGNCMFYALSEQLELVKGIQISHEALRQHIVQYLKENPTLQDGTELFNFVHGHQSWPDYLRNMAADGTWGDHIILHAAANCFKTCIHVISSLSHDLTIHPEHDVSSSSQFVLGHLHEHHYVSLRPKPGFSGGSKSSVAGYSQLSFPAASQTHLRSGIEGFSGRNQSSVAGYCQLPFPAASQAHLRSELEGFSFGSQSPVAGYSQLPFPAPSQTHLTSGIEGFSGGSQSSVAVYSQLPFPAAAQTDLTSGTEGFRFGSQSSVAGYSQLPFPAPSQTHLRSGIEDFSGGSQSSVAVYSQLPFPAAAQTDLTSGTEGLLKMVSPPAKGKRLFSYSAESSKRQRPLTLGSKGQDYIVGILQAEYKRRSLLKPLLWDSTLKLPIEDVYTRLKILLRRNTGFRLENNEVAMYDIFNTLRKVEDNTVLVEGSPGIGKTTFCLKIAYDWATGRIPRGHSFPEFKILLLLKCRDINEDIRRAIREQLLPGGYDYLEKELMDYMKDINNQENVLIILDGLDELPKTAGDHVHRLLQRRIFPFCYILATSRQDRGMKLRQYVDFDVLLQIEEFTETDAFAYIRKHFSRLGPEHLSNGERLINAIQANSFLHALRNNPLNLLLLCVVFEDYEGELPSRRTELYQIIVRCILRRFCAKKMLEAPQDDEALEKKFEQSLLALGELAWKCLLEDRVSFKEQELVKFEEMYKDLAARISGLIFKEASLKKINPQHEYHFFHLTFQEYLAAAYLAFLLLKKDVNIFKEFQLDFDRHIVVKYRQVFLFLSGILGEEASILFRQIGEKLKSENWHWLKCKEKEATFFTESFGESGNPEKVAMALCSLVPLPLDVQTDVDDYPFGEFFTVAKYCTNFSQLQHPVHLTLPDLSALGIFAHDATFGYLKFCPKLQTFSFSTSEPPNDISEALCDALCQNSTLLSLTVKTLCSLPCDVADVFGDSLAASNTLTSVTFELFHEWSEGWARALEKGLSADTPLKEVVLKIYGSLSETAIQALKRVLVNKSLTSLVITIFAEMQDSLAAALCEGLSEQAVLKSFTLVVFGRVSESGIIFLERGFLQNYSLNALEVNIFGELPDSWANVVKRIITANKAKQSCTFHPNTSGNIAAAKVACLTPVLVKSSFNLEQTLNVWGELSCEVTEAVGRLLAKSTPYRLTLNIHGNETDDVASSLVSYLKIEKCVHSVTVNIWGELTTNGKAAIEWFSGANHNANLKVIVHDLISDCSPCGLDFCIDHPSLLPSVFTKVKDTGTSELSLTISGVSDDWAQGLNDGLTISTSLTTLALTIENRRGESVGWMQRLLDLVLENTSLATLALTLTLYPLSGMGIDLGNILARNTSLTALSLTINSHVSNGCFFQPVLLDGLASNKSLLTVTLTVNSYSSTDEGWIEGLGYSLAENVSLRTLNLTINNYSITSGVLILDLGHGVASNVSLRTLNLTINNYSDTAGVLISDLGDGLVSNASLRILSLTINNYSIRSRVLMLDLGDGLASNKSLHTLTLTINKQSFISGACVEVLRHGLASNVSLHTLTLTINHYSGTGGDWIPDLGHGLALNKSLHTLTLTINNYSETDEVKIDLLGDSLARNKSLTTVGLTINNYSNTGGDWMKHLGDGLARNESLTTLGLTINSCSEVSEDELLELCNNLARSDTLTTVNLTINDHSSTSRGLGCDLSKCFADCKSLTALSLTVSLYGEKDMW